jgi:histidinol phosphatase-like enzyme (inositol monophosphatase family)
MELRTLLEFAVEACTEAGEITLEYFRKDFVVETKEDLSPVTVADRRTEERLRELIGKYYPSHGIIGEEFGGPGAAAEYNWFIDPIDGTLAFVRGVPIYGVMLGLEHRGEILLGVVNFPALQEIVYAAKGQGCYWNGSPARVSNTGSLREALLCHSGREYFTQHGRAAAYEELQEATSLQRTWGDCYGHVLVATGRADVCADPTLHEWDAAPLIPILHEAGGTFTDWHGKVTVFGGEGLSTNSRLLDAALAITRRYPRPSPPG